ncbi:hypothetical protein TPA0906_32210 [Streptomyces olivaceus]|uniref:hypothetical protein n=1 Tax=Streptomyces olivaceus TaxID=47716 RepID=UPI00087840A4|nr:hypothetical protein [Streptomyces olivaceus]AOW88414.1 hypothetical protein BC342_19920 [Streptomyces olivaceus]GHJ01356.1 hypothetical protein TPA0906_32210 [Streptomyces olivaceus]
MSNTRVPTGARHSYPAPGLALTPGHVRNQAMTVVAIPFVLIVVLAVVLATAGDDEAPGTGGLYGNSSLPGWDSGTGDGTTDDGTTDDGTGDGTVPDGSGGLTGEGTWPDDGTTDGTGTDDPTAGDTPEASGEDTPAGDPADSPYADPNDDAYADEDGPAATVTAYFDAINERDFPTAWDLGGRNLDEDYDHFVAGFDTTESDELTVVGTTGEDVSVTFVARQTDGSQQAFDGTYTVRDGVIVDAAVQERN